MYARVAEAENGEPVEIPVEDDGTILLSTLQGAFPGLTGLKYRAPSGAFRALKLVGQSVCTPECGWESALFVGVFPKEVRIAAIAANGNGSGSGETSASVSAALKPNCEADIALNAAAMSSLDEDERDLDAEVDCAVRNGEFDAVVSVGGDKQLPLPTGVCDLIVLGLSFRATEADLRHYFERFGELQFAEVKRDRHSEESRGFAFVRFRSHEAQTRCLLEKEHLLLGRRCDVRLPFKEQEKDKLPDLDANREAVFLAPAVDKVVANKLFVGRLPAEINEDDLRQHFGMFGKLSDCYIPKPFRAFAFVTFGDALDAQKAFETPTHVVKGATLNVTFAAPKRADEPFEPAAPAPARDRFPLRHARGGGGGGGGGGPNPGPGVPSGFPPRGAESLRHAVAAAPHALPFNHRNAGGQFQRGSAYGVQRKPQPQSPPSFANDYQTPQRSSEYSSHDRHERSRSRDHYRSRDRSRTRSRSRSRSRSPARHASYGHSAGGVITAAYTQPTGAGATSDVSAAYAAAAYEQAQRFYAYYSAVAQATAASQQQATAAQAQPASASANAAFNNMMAQAAASGVNPFTQFAGVSTMASAPGAQSSSLPRGGVPPPPPPPASGWQHSQSSSGKGGWWGR